jgi:hypothetical protein
MDNSSLFALFLIIFTFSCHRSPLSPLQELQSIQQDFFGNTHWDTQTRTALFSNLHQGDIPPPPMDSFLFDKDAFLNILPDSLLSQELKQSLTQKLSHKAVPIQPSSYSEKGGPVFYFSYPAIDDSGNYLLLLWESVHRGQGFTYAAIFTRKKDKWNMAWVKKLREWIE